MTEAEILLNSLSEDEIAAYTADHAVEPHVVIGSDRYITVPDKLKRIAVQYDNNIETVIFDCPRYWDGHDMSQMKIFINYMRKDSEVGSHLTDNVRVDEDDPNIMHFDWTVKSHVTQVKGVLTFLVCVKKSDAEGNNVNHWNSELCYDMEVSEGLECEETIVSQYPDIIMQLLTRMDIVEEGASPESIKKYIATYLATDEASEQLKDYVHDYLDAADPLSEENIQNYVSNYLDKNPLLFVIGPEKPGFECLWFNTSGSTDSGSNTTVSLLSSGGESIYAEVDESATDKDYNFDII